MEVEERGGVYVVVYEDGSCHPANDDEVQMWKELAALRARHNALKAAVMPVVDWWKEKNQVSARISGQTFTF